MKEFQHHIAELYLEKDRKRGVTPTFLWFMEEVGELSEAIRRAESAKARSGLGSSLADAAGRNDRKAIEEELADVAAWLASLANLLDVDLDAATRAKYPATCKRCSHKPCACKDG